MLDLTQLRKALSHMGTSSLRKLKIRDIQANTHNRHFRNDLNLSWFLEPLERMPLEVLDFSKNALSSVAPGLLRHKNLKEVYFQENLILETSFFAEIFFHQSLHVVVGSCRGYPGKSDNMTGSPLLAALGPPANLSVEQKTPRRKPSKCIPPSKTIFVIYFTTWNGSIWYDFSDRLSDFCPEKADNPCIHEFHLPFWDYTRDEVSRYCLRSQNTLTLLDLSNLGMLGTMLGKALCTTLYNSFLPKLEIFSLENSGVHLWNRGVFWGVPNLRVLNLHGNTVSLENDTIAEFFANKRQLQKLILSNTGLSTIHSKAFYHLDRLQVLDLSDNKLTDISFDLPRTGQIRELWLQNNDIQTLQPEIRKQLDEIARSSAIMVDISDNPLLCACTDTEFIRWMQTTRVYFREGDNYQCYGARTGINLIMNINLIEFDSLCNPSRVVPVVICVSVLSTLGVVGVCLSVVTLYRKRYSIMHWKYIRFTPPKLTFDENSSFRYDAFIVYNSDDKWWTHHALLAEMEDKRQLKLCIYLRDFPAGGAYADVIDDAIRQSRKTVLILSRRFCKSNWCLHEMSMVHNKLVAEGIDLTELVILSPLSSDVMTSTLTQLMQRKTTLNWTEDPDGQKLFWNKLEDAIRSPRTCPNIS